MSDINKKINLDVETTAKGASDDFKKLNTSIKEVTSNFSKLNKIASSSKGFISSIKKITTEIDKLNKSLFNLTGMTKAFETLQKKVDNISRSMAGIRHGTRGPNRSKAEIDAEKEEKERKALDKRLAAAIRYQNLKKASAVDITEDTKKDSPYAKWLVNSVAGVGREIFQNKSILGTLQALGTSGVGLLSAGSSKRISEKYNKLYYDDVDKLNKEIKALSIDAASPNITEAHKAKLEGDIADRKRKLDKITAERDAKIKKEEAKVSGRVAIAMAVIKLAIGTLNSFGQAIKATTGVTVSLKENFNNLINSIGAITALQGGAATYAAGSTLYTNAAARTQQMKYGLTSAQNYALSRTMSMMGMSGDEDLMYMNKNQVKLFSSMMDKYSSWYEKMESSGVLANIQEMQMDIQMFKEELAMEFMEWFSENKDTILSSIKNIAKFVMDIANVVCKTTGWIGKGISWLTGQNSSTLSDTMSSAATYSNATIQRGTTNNININMTNSATGVLSDQSQMENFFKEQIAQVSKELALQLE